MAKDKKIDEKENFLLYVPVKKHEEYEIRKGNVHLIFHHKKFAEKILQKIAKKPAVSDIKLDRLGSTVWQNLDGEKTVYDIGQILLDMPELKKEYKDIKEEDYVDGCHPIYARLIMFLRYMVKKGWISFKLSDMVLNKENEK
ncbi:PqqD family protein [Clostridium ihumii]|uniref:PqqD family protein n=1 Tax=Clostridium ihumii TaxID=1470356 RepID=UPI003D34181E